MSEKGKSRSTSIPPRPACIVGREKEISAAVRKLTIGMSSAPKDADQGQTPSFGGVKEQPIPKVREGIDSSPSSSRGSSIAEIVGVAGIGKTTLAAEIAHRCLDSGSFKAAIWVANEDMPVFIDRFLQHDREKHNNESEDLNSIRILPAIGIRLDELDLEGPYVIVLDGIDDSGMNTNIDAITRFVDGILPMNRIIITSRNSLPGRRRGRTLIRLLPLSGEDVYELVRCEQSNALGGEDAVLNLSQGDIDKIYAYTAGHPRAIVEGVFEPMLCNQWAHVDTALDRLERHERSELKAFFDSWFAVSIDELDEEAATILVTVAASSSPITHSEIARNCVLFDKTKLDEIIGQLENYGYLSSSRNQKSGEKVYFVYPFHKKYILMKLGDKVERIPSLVAERWRVRLSENPEKWNIDVNFTANIRDAFEWYCINKSMDWRSIADFGQCFANILIKSGISNDRDKSVLLVEVCRRTMTACEQIQDWNLWISCAINLGRNELHNNKLIQANDWLTLAETKITEKGLSEMDVYIVEIADMLAQVALKRGDLAEARRIFTNLQQTTLQGEVLPAANLVAEIGLGEVALEEDKFDEARFHFERAHPWAGQRGDGGLTSRALRGLGRLSFKLNQPEDAYVYYTEALKHLKDSNWGEMRTVWTTEMGVVEEQLRQRSRLGGALRDLGRALRESGTSERDVARLARGKMSLVQCGMPEEFLVKNLVNPPPATPGQRYCMACRGPIEITKYTDDGAVICPHCRNHFHSECWDYSQDTGLCPSCGH